MRRPTPRELRDAARDLRPPGGVRRFRAGRRLGPAFPPEAAIYRNLSPYSLRLGRLTPASGPPAVTLVLPTADPAAIFAGAKTAVSFAGGLAASLGRPLRIATIQPRQGGPGETLAPELTPPGLPGPVAIHRLGDGDPLPATDDDLWVATHWTTAHPLDIACRVGAVDPAQVLYLVQDYEPGFVPWSTDYALIRATYHAGFRIVVNARPLAGHLAREEGITVDERAIIAPHLPLDRLEQVAAARATPGQVGVFFYARPGKPRNLYPLGVAALRRAGQLLGADARRITVTTAGEPHPPFAVPHAPPVTVAAQTGWDGYFRLLEQVHVGLSLMYSPHPSHPPLELAISGAHAVTNRFGTARDDLHPRVTAAEADPEALAVALADAVRRALDAPPGAYEPLPAGALGRPLDDVISHLAEELR